MYAKNQICRCPTYHTKRAVLIRSFRRRPYRMKPTAVGFISLTTVLTASSESSNLCDNPRCRRYRYEVVTLTALLCFIACIPYEYTGCVFLNNNTQILTDWAREKIADISQPKFSNEYSAKKVQIFRKLIKGPGNPYKLVSAGLDISLALFGRPAIAWTNGDIVHRHIYAGTLYDRRIISLYVCIYFIQCLMSVTFTSHFISILFLSLSLQI